MNKTIEKFAREKIKEGLAKLTQGNHHKFKMMYANGAMSLDVDDVVDAMPADKLDCALSQVENTLRKMGVVDDKDEG
jgi:hypothetical protein